MLSKSKLSQGRQTNAGVSKSTKYPKLVAHGLWAIPAFKKTTFFLKRSCRTQNVMPLCYKAFRNLEVNSEQYIVPPGLVYTNEPINLLQGSDIESWSAELRWWGLGRE